MDKVNIEDIVNDAYPDCQIIKILKRNPYNVVLNIKKDKDYLLKVFHKRDSLEYDFMNYSIHKSLKSKHIIKSIELKKHKDFLFIIYPWFPNGDLVTFINKNKITESVLRNIAISILKALNVLHSNGYIHGDVKPENILVRNKKEFVLIDFDLLKYTDPDDLIYYSLNISGTIHYASPENYHGIYGGFSDIWALGITLYACAIKYCPFEGNKLIWKPLYKSKLSIYAKHFILSCLIYNYKRRKNVSELFNHPWITGNTKSEEILEKEFYDYFKHNSAKHHKKVIKKIENQKKPGGCCIIM